MIDPSGIPVVEGDPAALGQHAADLVRTGADFADTGARVHSGWQALAPVYDAPEAGQLLAATGPVQQVSASVGEDITLVGQALGDYAVELRQIQLRLGALRVDATALVTEVGGVEPSTEQADRSNELLSAAAVVPLVGWAATGGKFAVKGVYTFRGAKAWGTGRPSVVPKGAEQVPFGKNAKFDHGLKFTYNAPGPDGAPKNHTLHAHGADPRAEPGSNAAKGPIYRIRQGGHHYLDADGKRHTENSLKSESAAYNKKAANDTHMPYPKDQPSPDRPWTRGAVPNPAALFGPEHGHQQ